MQKIRNIIKKAALVLFAAVMASSCSMEKEQLPESLHKVVVQMSVSVGEMTKAETEDATTQEKVINTLRVYAFYGERLAGYAYRGATALNAPFYMDLELPLGGTYDVDFYLIANEATMAYEDGAISLSESMTKEQLESIKYTGLKRASALPMYCRQTRSVGTDGNVIDFTLGRSLAKLSVYAAKAYDSEVPLKVINVDLLSGGTRLYSYLFEQKKDVLDAIQPRLNDRNFLTSAVSVTTKVDRGYAPLFEGAYLPEVVEGVDSPEDWNISTGNERAAVLFVEYALEENDQYKYSYVYLPPIERNHHYKVCILVNAEGRISINYSVADWETAEVVNRVIDYPTHSYLRESIPVAEADKAAVPSGPATMSAQESFKGYFQMLYPEGDTWMPVLKGENKDLCEVKVYDNETNDPVNGYVPASNKKWYRIEVLPKDLMQVGDEVQLEIAYSATGAEIIDYLMINGSHNEYYWPYTGLSEQDANYIIITKVN